LNRTEARTLAVLSVYEADFGTSYDELLEERLKDEFYERLAIEGSPFSSAPEESQSAYIKRLLTGVSTHQYELDGYIEKYTKTWKFSRMPRLSIAILRVALFELLYMTQEVPTAAAVDSAVNIAKIYEDEKMPGYINGVLASFIKENVKEISSRIPGQ
jgi:N utilization substance protein B